MMSTAGAGPADPAGPPLMFRDAMGWWAIVLLVLGRQTGMLESILEEPRTAGGLAAACRVDERNAGAWLAAMTAHGYLLHQDGVFRVSPPEAAALRGELMPFDVGAILDFHARAPVVLPAVTEAIRTGRGVAPAVYHEAFGDSLGRIDAPLYRLALLDDWLARAGVADRLHAGIDVAEAGCSSGLALLDLAARCPASRFIGYDIDAEALQSAAAEAARRDLANIRFALADGSALPDTYDLILVLDAFHHLPRPEAFLAGARAALRPGGRLLLAEPTASGNLDADVASPFARITLSAILLYCLQEALHDGGAGIAGRTSEPVVRSLLTASGFQDVLTLPTDTGYTVFVATA